MRKSFLLFVFVLPLLITACGSTPAATQAEATMAEEEQAASPAAEEPQASSPAASALDITASGDGYEAPMQVQSGWVTVSLTNQGDEMRQAAILRFEDGTGMEDLAASMQSDEPGVPDFLSPVGGPAGVFPGSSGSAIVHLTPGNYVIMDPAPDDEGVPALAKGFLQPLEVTDQDNEQAEPQANLTITLKDYLFDFDASEVRSGLTSFEITNSGPAEFHEVAVIKLNDGASIQDFLAAMGPDAPPGPPPGQGVGGLSAIAVGEQAYLTVELEAGVSYGLICFLPSGQNQDIPHFMFGMVSQFTVPE